MKRYALVLLLFATRAHGYSAGLSGYSGKPPEQSCNQCHSGGPAPQVTLNGPASLQPGETATYTFDVVTGATSRVAGFDVAASNGTLANLVQNNASFLDNGEISHKLPLAKGQTVQVRFDFTAPVEGGDVTLFATGLSADGNGSTSGDQAAATTLAISVSSPGDLAGLDLAGAIVDLAQPVDAITAASPGEPKPEPKPDLGPPRNEPTWACDCQLAAAPVPVGAAPLYVALGFLGLALRRRR